MSPNSEAETPLCHNPNLQLPQVQVRTLAVTITSSQKKHGYKSARGMNNSGLNFICHYMQAGFKSGRRLQNHSRTKYSETGSVLATCFSFSTELRVEQKISVPLDQQGGGVKTRRDQTAPS
ncbi:hypothetical protein GOODEAATRI_018247 [Goodea atripinnis]|uniref:Uncharacterized protein n=1 Tax=Goodea atripinnis TaxID=208336 RepID=A0ABV0NCK6_9TELE